MIADEIQWLDATAQAALVRDGELSARELVDSAIGRIERFDPAIRSVIYERYDRARAEAGTVDRSAPFAGVPTLVKETTAIAGEPHDLGVPLLAELGRRATADAPIVTAMRAAGLVPVAQSTAPQFALLSTSETELHGSTHNPWRTDLTSGGSSGGASAAVAAGLVPLAQGGDGGGSLRMPASFTHLVGLKPSRGLIGNAKPGGDRWGHSVPGFVTRSIRDTALMMDLFRTGLPGAVGERFEPGDLVRAIDRDPGSLRIGVLSNRTTTGAPVDDEVDAATLRAAAVFTDLGHHVEEAHPARLMDPDNLRFFFDALSVGAAADVDALTPFVGRQLDENDLDPVTMMWDRRGRAISGMDLAVALNGIATLTRELAGWWESGYDVLLSPVFATPPLELGWPWRDADGLQKSVDVLRFTAPFNSSGQPALALPVDFSADGAPLGVQIVGALGSDDLLLSLGAQFERARPWAHLHPALVGTGE